MRFLFFVIALGLCNTLLFGQYTVNGNATRNDCHCYTLTPNTLNQSGSVWNNIKIDLTQSFDFNFNINLGCDDAGADGIVFVLQPISTSVGTTGGGLGYDGVTPSVGVTIDTWQNTPNNDPFYDHIAIQLNGNIDHNNTTANIAGPVTAINGNNNIEDCSWHSLRIKWDATAKELSAFVDGNLRVSAVKDLVADVFSGNPKVFWGFTGSTGGARNLQQFCTALSPKFTFLQGQKRCINEPVKFVDSTISFTQVQKRYWDFGDGSPLDSVNNSPVHTYSVPGNYTVTQTVTGADGCVEVNTQQVKISRKPVVDFTITDSCISNQIQFTDASTAPFGTISEWFWDFDNGASSTAASFTTQFASGGDKNIRLFVKTDGGCASDTVTKTIHIYRRPVLDVSYTDSVCLGTAINFTGILVSSPDPVQAFAWNFGDNIPVSTQNASYNFSTAGSHTVQFIATSTGNAGCLGIVTKDVFIKAKPVAFFKTSALCQGVSTTLIDSSYQTDGTAVNSWWWSLSNGAFSTAQHPTVTYPTGDTAFIKLVAGNGTCFSDTLQKAVELGQQPVVAFGYAGNLCEGEQLQFTDSSVVAHAAIAQWQWTINGLSSANEKNPRLSFGAGLQRVGLLVVSDKGCKSGTVFKPLLINGQPGISMVLNSGCKNENISFYGSTNPGTVIKNWNWNFGDGTTADTIQPAHRYADSGTYTVQLFVVDEKGCKSTTLENQARVYSTNADAGAAIVNASPGQPVQLQVTGGLSYQWFPADGLSDPLISNPVASNTASKKYLVRAFTPWGCDTYDSVQINIFNGPEIYVPTAFNPMSVAGNRLLTPVAVGLSKFDYFMLYNRYGQVVFTSSDPYHGWDGNYKGRPQNAGVYVWIAAGKTFRGTAIVRRGTVVLLR